MTNRLGLGGAGAALESVGDACLDGLRRLGAAVGAQDGAENPVVLAPGEVQAAPRKGRPIADDRHAGRRARGTLGLTRVQEPRREGDL